MTEQTIKYDVPRSGFPLQQEILGLLTVAVVGAIGYFAFPDDLAFLTRLISITFLVLSLDLVTGYCGVATLGQAALFGGDDHAAPTLRLVDVEPWSKTEQMAKERENFGFYFAAHPVEQWRAVAVANGARTYAALMESGVAGGGRSQAVMAAMVEGVNRGKTRRGADFVRADFSDSSGQFSAACFEESLVDPMLQWAKDGTCLLLTVELDAPSPEEPPRVTVRGARPLSEVKVASSMQLRFDVLRPEVFGELTMLLQPGEPGRGEVIARLRTGKGQDPLVRLGNDFHLDGELAERLASVEGLANVQLSARRGSANLRLVA